MQRSQGVLELPIAEMRQFRVEDRQEMENLLLWTGGSLSVCNFYKYFTLRIDESVIASETDWIVLDSRGCFHVIPNIEFSQFVVGRVECCTSG